MAAGYDVISRNKVLPPGELDTQRLPSAYAAAPTSSWSTVHLLFTFCLYYRCNNENKALMYLSIP